MRVGWLSLVGYRSYENLEWAPDAGVNLVIGPNGAGKTNLLEAVGYLATLRSFRGAPDDALIGDTSESSVIRAGLSGEERDRLIEIEIHRTRPKRAQVDKTPLRRTADLLGVTRVVTFLPDDLDLVKRGPAQRRDLLDEIAVQLWPAAYLDQQEHDRSLRQRNAFLKSGDRDEVTLSVWDSRLAQAGGRVVVRRMRVLDALLEHLDESYQSVAHSDDRVELAYRPTWTEETGHRMSPAECAALIGAALEKNRKTDLDRRMTTVGPHRDEPGFLINGRDARLHASQGEQRTMALSVKLAAHAAVTSAFGDPPILLLDDVFSELDQTRAAALGKALPEHAQTIISSARPEDVPVSGRAWAVTPGTVG
jgi:DNA replication and repair protein RecF